MLSLIHLDCKSELYHYNSNNKNHDNYDTTCQHYDNYNDDIYHNS